MYNVYMCVCIYTHIYIYRDHLRGQRRLFAEELEQRAESWAARRVLEEPQHDEIERFEKVLKETKECIQS